MKNQEEELNLREQVINLFVVCLPEGKNLIRERLFNCSNQDLKVNHFTNVQKMEQFINNQYRSTPNKRRKTPVPTPNKQFQFNWILLKLIQFILLIYFYLFNLFTHLLLFFIFKIIYELNLFDSFNFFLWHFFSKNIFKYIFFTLIFICKYENIFNFIMLRIYNIIAIQYQVNFSLKKIHIFIFLMNR